MHVEFHRRNGGAFRDGVQVLECNHGTSLLLLLRQPRKKVVAAAGVEAGDLLFSFFQFQQLCPQFRNFLEIANPGVPLIGKRRFTQSGASRKDTVPPVDN